MFTAAAAAVFRYRDRRRSDAAVSVSVAVLPAATAAVVAPLVAAMALLPMAVAVTMTLPFSYRSDICGRGKRRWQATSTFWVCQYIGGGGVCYRYIGSRGGIYGVIHFGVGCLYKRLGETRPV